MKKTLALILAGAVWAITLPAQSTPRVPDRLTDAEFWTLVTDISEPGGYFRITDNFTSNEMEVGAVSTMLRATKVSGGAYVGVGPEQNFSYIAAIRPAVAFVIDIRRQAVIQHLMFKALFELSKDRSDFISLTFSRPRPAGSDTIKGIQELWDSYYPVAIDTAMARRTYQSVLDQLTKTHQFKLNAEEIGSLKYVWDAFAQFGPTINTQAAQGGGGGRGANRGTFVSLTAQSLDSTNTVQSFLSTDDNYKFVKGLHEKNLIIPVSGDFAGPKALRAIGAWLTKQNATLSAFYVSNVEQYLFMDGKEAAYYANTATLPLNAASVFIRPYSLRTPSNAGFGRGGGGGGVNFGAVKPLCPIAAYLKAFQDGKVRTNADAVSCAGLP